MIKDDKIENTIVITSKGKVYQCFGNKHSVFPDIDLKDEIIGAYITHNHPNIPENINTFTTQDRNLFYTNKLEVLRGIKGNYIFEMNRNSKFKERIPMFSDLEEEQIDMNIQTILNFLMKTNTVIRGGKMTDKEKWDIIEKEINEMYSVLAKEERKQTFKDELEAIEYSKKFNKKLFAHIAKRKKELGISTK